MEPNSEGDNFIRDFILLCKDTEIPDLFALWSGIGAVSCVLGRRVYVDFGLFATYPNLYTILVAGSGTKKSTAIRQATRLLTQLNPKPNMVSQKMTTEALIKALRVEESQTDGTNRVYIRENCTGYGFVDELSLFLNRNTYEAGMGSLLIQLFDCASFSYRTMARGEEAVNDPCFGILAASTVDWIKSAVPIDAVGSGLTSRMIFVYVDKPAPPVPIPSFGPDKKLLQEKLYRALQRMQMLSGEFKLTEDAWTFHKDEYMRMYTSPMREDKTLSGYANRRADHLIRLAMIFSVSESSDLIIRRNHMVGASELLALSESYMPLVLSLITSSIEGEVITRIYTTIKKVRRISRAELLGMFLHQLTSRQLQEVLDTLVASNSIETFATGKTLYYQLVVKKKD